MPKNKITLACLVLAVLPFAAAADVEEIIVSATGLPTPAAQIGASVDVLDAADLEGLVYLHDALPSLGVNVPQSGGAGTQSNVFLRGLPGRHTDLIIDGISMFDPNFNQVLWQDVTTDGVGRIEVLRGSHGVLYGSNAVAGVVSQFTEIGGARAHNARAEYGRFDTRRLVLSGKGGTAGGIAYGYAVSDLKTGGISAVEADDGNREANGYENRQFNGRADIPLGRGVVLELAGRFGEGEADIDGGFPLADKRGAGQKFDRRAARVGVVFERGGDRFRIDATDYDSRIDHIENDRTANTTEAARRLWAYRGEVALDDGVQLVFGFERQDEEYDSGVATFEADNVAALALLQWTPRPPLTLTGAVRRDRHDAFGGETTYRLTAALAAGEMWRWRLAYGTGYRAPSLSELYLPVFGNPDLAPETSVSREVGVDFTPAAQIETALTLFEIEIEDVIGYDPATFRNTQIDGTTRSRGVEWTGRWSPDAAFDVRLRIAYTDSDKPAADNSGATEREVRVPRWQGGFELGWRPHDRLEVDLGVRRVRDVVDVGGVALDDYTLARVAARYCLLYTSPSPRDATLSRMPSSA